MNIFVDRKTQKFFSELSNSLEGKEKNKFTKAVKKTFDEKITSELDLPTYKLTSADLKRIAGNF